MENYLGLRLATVWNFNVCHGDVPKNEATLGASVWKSRSVSHADTYQWLLRSLEKTPISVIVNKAAKDRVKRKRDC